MLLNMGVKYVKTIQEMPIELMEKVMGKNGIALWKKAQGIDNSLVQPYHERKSISSSLSFERDTINVQSLKSILMAMTEKLAFYLP